MPTMRALLCCGLLLTYAAVAGADVGVATIANGATRVLRGATWYKLVPGVRIDDGDIVEAAEHASVQLEFAAGCVMNVVGPATMHVVHAAAGAPVVVAVDGGWAKAIAKPPGFRMRTPRVDIVAPEAVVVVRASQPVELFVESGTARVVEMSPAGAEAAARDVARGQHASLASDGAYAVGSGAPKRFVDAMPKPYTDALPTLASKFKTPARLTVDRDISYAEAEPWLAGRDRVAFQKRFVARLRDPAFRRAVEPHVARYPMWDRMLHPEKYAPKQPVAAKP